MDALVLTTIVTVVVLIGIIYLLAVRLAKKEVEITKKDSKIADLEHATELVSDVKRA